MGIINIYTKRAFGLDYTVWVVMLAAALLSLGLLGYKLASHEACNPELIHINGLAGNDYETFDANQLLTFSIGVLRGDQVNWDFGDRSGTGKQATVVTYQFPVAGNYQVKAIVKSDNSTCEKTVMIKIRPLKSVIKQEVQLEILGEPYAVEGDEKIYSCNDVANTYLWRITGVANSQAQNSASAKFIFPGPGNYTIELMLDNNPLRTATKLITVIDKIVVQEQPKPVIPRLLDNPRAPAPLPGGQQQPPPPVAPATDNKPPAETPEKSKKKEVLPETFKTELDEVIGLKKTPEELADKYLFYGGTTKVRINNDPALKGFTEFCYQMRSTKKYTLQSVSFDKDASGITVINVVLKKRSLIHRLMGQK